MEHTIKTHTPFYQEIADGKKPFEFRLNDRNYKVGDTLHHLEYDPEKQEETGRQLWCDVVYVIYGGQFGIPEGYCIMTQHTQKQVDFIRDYGRISVDVLPRFEAKLNHRMGGNISERINHVLNELESSATNSVFRAKNFLDDIKTQFKALELVVDGISSDQYNHSQKRVIANHVINMLRDMVDRINKVEFNYSYGIYERFDFFRSDRPEKELYRKYRELKDELDHYKKDTRPHDLEDKNEPLPF